jgi:hypothetical protein
MRVLQDLVRVFQDPVMAFSMFLLVLNTIIAMAVLRPQIKDPKTSEGVRRMVLGSGILLGLGSLFALSMAMCYWASPGAGCERYPVAKDLFDAVKVILPPIAMAIIGFYFGTRVSSGSESKGDKTTEPQGAQNK